MTRRNNFDALRLIAATSVMFSHAFLLSEGRQDNEPLMLLTGGQSVLGVVGVFIFFIISGFLVTQSFEATTSPVRFVAKRALRIYPGLAVCILLCTFILGSLLTTLPLGGYLASGDTWEFLAANLVLNVEHNSLPGVRFTGFDIGHVVDGPLWSLPCEVVMYAMVLLLGVLGLIRLGMLALLFALGIVCLWFDTASSPYFLGGVGWLLGFFVAGMLLYKLQRRHPPNRRLALLALAGLLISVPLGSFQLLFPLFGGYLVIYLALEPALPPLPATHFGDLSYGLYIYGWPVEQLLLYLTGGALTWWQVFPLALAVTTLVAFCSWYLVERPFIRSRGNPKCLATRRVLLLPARDRSANATPV